MATASVFKKIRSALREVISANPPKNSFYTVSIDQCHKYFEDAGVSVKVEAMEETESGVHITLSYANEEEWEKTRFFLMKTILENSYFRAIRLLLIQIAGDYWMRSVIAGVKVPLAHESPKWDPIGTLMDLMQALFAMDERTAKRYLQDELNVNYIDDVTAEYLIDYLRKNSNKIRATDQRARIPVGEAVYHDQHDGLRID